VLDLSRIIAGPCAARVLAELGADVISLQREKRLDWALSFHLVFNAGKRSVTLDFTTDEGKRRLWALVDAFRPQALIQNYRNLELARQIGVDPAALHAHSPGLAYTHLSAYGDEGGWRDRPGFEQVVQAVSGIQRSYGAGGEPRLLPSPVIDIGCGLLGAFATLMGLYHERRTGQGLFASTHLTSVAVLLQLPQIAAFQREGCIRRARTRGSDVVYDAGQEVVASILRARDAFVCLAGPRGDLARWMDRVGLRADGAAAPEPGALGVARGRFLLGSAERWRRSLAAVGVERSVALMELPPINRLVEDIRRHDPRPAPMVRRRAYPGSPQPLAFVGSPLRLSLTPLADVDPPPRRGGDTREVMALIGEDLPPGAGVVGYPAEKPLWLWLSSFLRWGYFAWRSGNI
jgi:crotonobetainyl-CoA:carnitine CoA-transferase CaiB-like acyl-CoA transferase